MNCPNCKSDIIQNNICTNCGINVLIYNKINEISNHMYNKGLAKAKEKDISGAIDCLNKSILYNKSNNSARNLLGVIYFEHGYLGKAYNEWLKSTMVLEENDLPHEYIKKINTNADNLEKLNDTIKMYNQSIVYLNQKSDDMAIIQLKKAVDINPKFIDALNLLSLCYIVQKDNAKALNIIEKVLQIDKFNVTANTYLKEIGSPKIKNNVIKEEKTNEKNVKTYTPVRNIERGDKIGSFNFFSIILLIIGLLVGFSAFYILIMPSTIESNKAIITKKEQEIELLKTEKDEFKAISDKAVSDLNNVKNDLEQKNKTLEEKVSIQDKIQNINNASDLISKAKYEEASILLFSIDKAGLAVDIQERYAELVAKANPRTAAILYERASVKYRAKEYDESATIFNECLKYALKTSREYGDSLYFLGEIALVKEDNVLAKKNFTEVVEEHENARNYWKAKQKLAKL